MLIKDTSQWTKEETIHSTEKTTINIYGGRKRENCVLLVYK